MRDLRVAKRRAALLIAIADIAGLWPLERVTRRLSAFAEAALGRAVRHLLAAAARGGEIELADPDDPERDSGFIVLGMGKLGARELNYSSDIDLILLFDARARALSPAGAALQHFFARLARDLVQLMAERTGRRLCLPHRPAAAARSRLDAARASSVAGGAQPITRAPARTGSARR